MTDLEMTKLCAQAMGVEMGGAYYVSQILIGGETVLDHFDYNPLHDDAQAMALVKHCKLTVRYYYEDATEDMWAVLSNTGYGSSSNLNQAIVRCVARMQAAKVPA